MDVVPSELDEVISVTPAIWPNWRSSGAATEEAMISALAPGRLAPTAIVGKSTCGSGETGSTVKAIAPARAIATVSSVVATGRRMKGAEMFMALAPGPVPGRASRLGLAESLREPVKKDVNDRRGVEREHLAEQQSADHGDAQRTAQLGADARSEGQRNTAEQRRHGGHHDGAEAQQTGFVDRVGRVLSVLALAFSAKSTIMMPFFFTMPISRMMPMMATTLRS